MSKALLLLSKLKLLFMLWKKNWTMYKRFWKKQLSMILFKSVAKQITLNTQSFTHTRMRLSECWDKLKHLDKERKKVRAQQKAAFKENADKILYQLKEIAEAMQSGQMNHADAQRKLDEVA